MLRINKVSEYGVLALSFIGRKSEPQSARDISTGLNLPYEIMAKTLQRLKDADLVHSSKGINGGYVLKSPLSEISVSRVLTAFEGPLALVDCGSDSTDCSRHSDCEMKVGMQRINLKVKDVLDSVKLSELFPSGVKGPNENDLS